MATLPDLIFRAEVLKRALAIIPKKEKEIILENFNYMTDAESRDTVIIRYEFKNALWYTLDNEPTIEERHVVVRAGEQRQIQLTVQGLFRKSNYIISLQPDKVYISEVGQN